MKISLRWVFDHIIGDYTSVTIAHLTQQFIKTTAEIDSVHAVTFPRDTITAAQVIQYNNNVVTLYSAEYDKEYQAPIRHDIALGAWYLITLENNAHTPWATVATFGGTKTILLPALHHTQELTTGTWKEHQENDDYIIEIDNKSINHRPDLWGHRGIAREIAALLHLPLRPLDTLLAHSTVINKNITDSCMMHNYSLSVKDTRGCSNFAALLIDTIDPEPSSITMALRLSRLDMRSINFLIDSTNYVMLDLGHPMHAFDAHTISHGLTVRKAYESEKLSLLDGETITLTTDDIVIADGQKAISLAGIMGGSATGITEKTNSVIIEAAHFDATTIRKTSMHHKKRTESSSRFEKNLDPHQISDVIQRFLFILTSHALQHTAHNIIMLGHTPPAPLIEVEHSFIESRLGISLTSEQIQQILHNLSFIVHTYTGDNGTKSTITIPSWRATKDSVIPEDIVEEIGRFMGYDSIPRILPDMRQAPTYLSHTYRMRDIQQLLSYGFSMREIYGYSFFDESFLKTVSWQPAQYVTVKNPVSENYYRLVTTLQLHLLHALRENASDCKAARFFEIGRTWNKHGDTIQEKKVLSGIFYDHEKNLDFYTGKTFVMRLLSMLSLQKIEWNHGVHNGQDMPWLIDHLIATMTYDGIPLGIVGVVDTHVITKICGTDAHAFIFELDLDLLLSLIVPEKQYIPLPKYPSVRRDISILIAREKTIASLTSTIKASDQLIEKVILVDFFEKPEWRDKKSVTFHIEIRDDHKTLEVDEIELVWKNIVSSLEKAGATIR